MFVDELRRAIEAAPRCRLSEVAKVLWNAVAGGQIDETDAEQLSNLIDARRALPAPAPVRRSGTRPRTPASIERRRRWAASGALPVALAARFTIAEQAVLAVVAGEVVKHGRCDLYIAHIAALAGVSETSVRNALRQAKNLGLVAIEIRRVTTWRNASNVVTVVSAEWSSWLVRGGRGPGCKSAQGTVYKITSGTNEQPRRRTGDLEGAEPDRKGFRDGRGRYRPASLWTASGMRRDGRVAASDAGPLPGSR
ncbi:hypothetical protein [Methylobacterium fujisawaense]